MRPQRRTTPACSGLCAPSDAEAALELGVVLSKNGLTKWYAKAHARVPFHVMDLGESNSTQCRAELEYLLEYLDPLP